MTCILKFGIDYHYSVGRHERKMVFMPRHARVIHVDEQDGELFVWAECEPSNDRVETFFEVIGTGHNIPPITKREVRVHLGTLQMSNGLVWHVYQIGIVKNEQTEKGWKVSAPVSDIQKETTNE